MHPTHDDHQLLKSWSFAPSYATLQRDYPTWKLRKLKRRVRRLLRALHPELRAMPPERRSAYVERLKQVHLEKFRAVPHLV